MIAEAYEQQEKDGIRTELKQLRYFNRCCPVRRFSGSVFHGSPLDGLVEMLRDGRLVPQGHAELPDEEWLSVSVNDNVLRMFSDHPKNRQVGFAATVELEVVHLDPLHCYLATGWSERMSVSARGDEIHDTVGRRLGYTGRFEPEMDAATLARLVGDRDGLAFPFTRWCDMMQFHFGSWNEEAEIALNEHGCRKVWERIDTLWVDGEEIEGRKQ